MGWNGADYCNVFISCSDSNSDGTHQRWASDIMLNFSKQGLFKVLDFNWNLSPGKPLKTAIFMKSTWNCTRYYSLRWKAVSRYQYTVRFVVKPLKVLVLYCSVFNCMCCSFCFHLGTHIKSCALCVALLSFTSVKHSRLHRSSSVHKLFLCICWSLGCLMFKTVCVICVDL